jgi:hypothetical protein
MNAFGFDSKHESRPIRRSIVPPMDEFDAGAGRTSIERRNTIKARAAHQSGTFEFFSVNVSGTIPLQLYVVESRPYNPIATLAIGETRLMGSVPTQLYVVLSSDFVHRCASLTSRFFQSGAR